MGAEGWPSLVAIVLLFALTGGDPGTALGSPAPSDIAAFLARHWQRPLAANGPAPGNFSPLEASLSPAACGACHPRQFADWRSALHSHAMSPGLLGQLQAMGPAARDQHQACLQCHAPRAEQEDHLVKSLLAGRMLPPLADGASSADGLTCAGCHVRGNRRFGPPRSDGTVPAATAHLPHDGWQATRAFEDSRFCAACHQFEAGGPGLNGKPFENTYEEWRASRYARVGVTCQSCHMPQRRHLWRGIHDPAMVRSGLTIGAELLPTAPGRVAAELNVANTGVGHDFPTYVTPRVEVEIAQLDRHGKVLTATVLRRLISRDVSLDLTVERADTRLKPDELRHYRYDRARDPRAVAVVFSITVFPDAFYAGFYRATLKDPSFRTGRAAIRAALRRAQDFAYELYDARLPLPARTPEIRRAAGEFDIKRSFESATR